MNTDPLAKVGCIVLLGLFYVWLVRQLWVLHKEIREEDQRHREAQQYIGEQKKVLRALYQSMGGSLSNLPEKYREAGSDPLAKVGCSVLLGDSK